MEMLKVFDKIVTAVMIEFYSFSPFTKLWNLHIVMDDRFITRTHGWIYHLNCYLSLLKICLWDLVNILNNLAHIFYKGPLIEFCTPAPATA